MSQTKLRDDQMSFNVSTGHDHDGSNSKNIAYADITDTPLKSTGAEINTGTEDGKIVTPKAIADSKLADYIRGDGWISANATWEFVSVDDPTGIFRVNADVTGKYSAGMRIKFTNGGNVIYGIITVVNAYGADEAGYTYIKFLHEIDPTDSLALYLMANSEIIANYYSTQKAPLGFPLESNKWTYTNITAFGQYNNGSPKDTWINGNSNNIVIPIGSWEVSFIGSFKSADNSAHQCSTRVTLSIANNSASNAKFTALQNGYGSNFMVSDFCRKDTLNLTSKTTYYINTYEEAGGMIAFGCQNTYVRCLCAYL